MCTPEHGFSLAHRLLTDRANISGGKNMTDIIKKNGGTLATEWDPFRAMREMLRWDPFREMAPVMSFERLGWNPSFDVTENKDAYVFKADVPGVKKEDLEISMTGNRLAVSGKRDTEQETKNDTYYTYERQYGTFTRTFTLPDGADVEHARSELKEGVLTLVVPKKPAMQAKKIPIATSSVKS
jgi:HSP20 family protein